MDRKHEMSVQPWGTLAELLLVCAVSRHGTNNWDSIAMELQNRTFTFSPTPQNCEDKFHNLQRRFNFESPNDDASVSLIPMVDELRRLRVEELRREVRLCDVSILSLELKVKRLEEDREGRSKDEAPAELQVDLTKKNNLESDGEPLPENHAENTNSCDVSDSYERDNRSFNESNFTSEKGDAEIGGVLSEQVKSEPNRNGPDPARTGPERECDWSVNSKALNDDYEMMAKVDDERRGESRATSGPDESKEPWESVCEFERERNEVVPSKQSSERKRLKKNGSRNSGISGADYEPKGDEVSPAIKKFMAVKLESLVKLLGNIRSHRLGSVFERRLRSQESERCKNLIRQHMDLQTVQARLDRGIYSDCTPKFFRDILLLFNNAIIFFRRNSPEHIAAQDLRGLVLKEMKVNIEKSKPMVNGKPESKAINKSSTATISSKRNNTRAPNQSASKKGSDKKEKEIDVEDQNRKPKSKSKSNEKKMDGIFVKNEMSINKKRSQEIGRQKGSNYKSVDIKHEYGGNELSSHDALEVKMEKKENTKKKHGVARFLKRMKQNSPKEEREDEYGNVSEDDTKVDVSEDDTKVEEEEEEEEEKKGKISERVTRSYTLGRRVREKECGKGKRGVSRPFKKPDSSGKRRRDDSRQSQVDVGGTTKKRYKR